MKTSPCFFKIRAFWQLSTAGRTLTAQKRHQNQSYFAFKCFLTILFSYTSAFSQFCCNIHNWLMFYLFIIPPYLRGSRYPPNKSWLCDLRPLLSHWGWAGHSGWTPQCCGSAWKKHKERQTPWSYKKTHGAFFIQHIVFFVDIPSKK